MLSNEIERGCLGSDPEIAESWRPGTPPFILIPQISNLSGTILSPNLHEKASNFLRELADSLERQGSPVYFGPVDNFPNDNGMVINPVYLGKLPEKVIEALKGNTRDLRAVLRDNLPEVYPPLAVQIGREMGINLHPNFTNLVIFEGGDIFNILEGEPLKALMRTLMAKTGSWKAIGLPYDEGNFGHQILATIEGGQPRINDLDTLGFRLQVLASVKKVGGFETIEGKKISSTEWKSSTTLKNMIDLGRFLGAKKLLPSPIKINDLVQNDKLADLIIRLAGFTRQQEGAYASFSPEFLPPEDFPWNGIMVVTRTGSDNGMMALKSNPDETCFVPGIPLRNGHYGKIEVEEIDTGKPSVEAEEFSYPLFNFDQTNLLFHGQEIKGPPIIAVVHLHTAVEGIKDNEPIYQLTTDITKFPPVGCGVDAMAAMSAYYMKQAIEAWKQSNYFLRVVYYYVPNHGTNFFIFPENKEGNLHYPDDPFFFFKEAINEGMIKLTDKLPQV